MSSIKRFLLFGFVLSIVSVAFATGDKTTTPEPAQSTVANDSSYVIGPEDVLMINVWKEKDISGSVPVRPDGKISMPLLNDIQAAGLTPMQLMASIAEKLKQFITDPQVTVTVTSINSRKIYILGEVTRPGAFPLVPDMTVLQAITSAGGPTPYAKRSGIYILRAQHGSQTKLPFNYKQVVKGSNPEQNILLRAGDTIVVP